MSKRAEIKRFVIYAVRWQASSLVLAPCLMWLGHLGAWTATIIANLIGAIIMYPMDKYIFKEDK